ncbi:MAG TPA: hypothetical protein VKA40_10410 [Nitrososphaera sp.]|nr:hypothetical protein [Nitrososphaera sp.]
MPCGIIVLSLKVRDGALLAKANTGVCNQSMQITLGSGPNFGEGDAKRYINGNLTQASALLAIWLKT